MLLELIALFLAGVVSSIPLVFFLRLRRTLKEKNASLLFAIAILAFLTASFVIVEVLSSLSTVVELVLDSDFRFWGLLAYGSSFFISVRLFGDPGYRQPTRESTLVPVGEGKDCWFCKNEIPSHVKICPLCYTYQSRLTLGVPPAAIVFFVLLFAAGPFGRWYLGLPQFREGASFHFYASQVRVLSSTVEFRSDDERTFVIVLGRIQNDSDVTWKYIELEVPFFNREGVLVDTISSRTLGLHLVPHAETTFRVFQETIRPEEDYFRHEVIVKDAIDKAYVPF